MNKQYKLLTFAMSSPTPTHCLDVREYNKGMMLFPSTFNTSTVAFKVGLHDNTLLKTAVDAANSAFAADGVADQAHEIPAGLMAMAIQLQIVLDTPQAAARTVKVGTIKDRLKDPKAYEAFRRRGFSKPDAARISNSRSKHASRGRLGSKRNKRSSSD